MKGDKLFTSFALCYSECYLPPGPLFSEPWLHHMVCGASVDFLGLQLPSKALRSVQDLESTTWEAWGPSMSGFFAFCIHLCLGWQGGAGGGGGEGGEGGM